MSGRNENANNTMEGDNKYVQLAGRDTIHRVSCRYISGSKRKLIHIDSLNNIAKEHFCTKCCRDLLSKPYKVVLDLEMCRVPGNSVFAYSHEIIQIGAVILNEEYEVVSEFSTYVRPEYGKIDRFITKLTGIEEGNTNSAPLLKDAMKLFLNWLNLFKVESIYAWSETDYKQFSYELNYKELHNSKIDALLDAGRWIDYQKTFGERYGYHRSVSLEDALVYSAIEQSGRAHNGLDDAFNTAQLIRKLELHPDYVPYVKPAGKKQEDALTFSLGDLLGNLFPQSIDRMAV